MINFLLQKFEKYVTQTKTFIFLSKAKRNDKICKMNVRKSGELEVCLEVFGKVETVKMIKSIL